METRRRQSRASSGSTCCRYGKAGITEQCIPGRSSRQASCLCFWSMRLLPRIQSGMASSVSRERRASRRHSRAIYLSLHQTMPERSHGLTRRITRSSWASFRQKRVRRTSRQRPRFACGFRRPTRRAGLSQRCSRSVARVTSGKCRSQRANPRQESSCVSSRVHSSSSRRVRGIDDRPDK
jgi:hypothetical protein